MGKILHLIPDEKVTDNVIENFENIFNDNVFFVLGNNDKRKHCNTKKENVIFGESDFFTKENIADDVVAVVIHGLNYTFAKLLIELNQKIKIAWFVWGFDMYGMPKIMDKLYAPKSLKYIKNTDSKFTVINFIKKKRYLRRFYYKYLNKTDDFYTIYEQAQRRINFFCTYIREDYELYTNYYPNKLIYQEIGYFSIEQYLAGQNDLRVDSDAKDILVGNSNSLENNHLDVFDTIKRTGLKEKVFVPLSYGNNQKYKKTVLEEGRKYLGDNFQPLLDFMKREDYLRLLSGCSTAVFYHYRQQAMGNILALLYMGVRVYLAEKNPVYQYLKRIGIIVFDFDKEFSLYSNS